jgi:hypothetical protein
VVRIARASKILDVTAVAIRRDSPPLRIYVATDACDGRVRARQRELRECVVIERGVQPICRCVTRLTSCWEVCLNVVGISYARVVLDVASVAVRRRCRIYPIDMATAAGDAYMCARQRKLCVVRVIKRHVDPVCCRVTGQARRREARLSMVGISHTRVVLDVAGVAVRRGPRKLPANVATAARHRHVRARQREIRGGVVIERGARPRRGGVAGQARGGKTGLGVIGGSNTVVVLNMTGIAIRRCSRRIVAA